MMYNTHDTNLFRQDTDGSLCVYDEYNEQPTPDNLPHWTTRKHMTDMTYFNWRLMRRWLLWQQQYNTPDSEAEYDTDSDEE